MFRMNENLLENRPAEGEDVPADATVEIPAEAMVPEDMENLGLSVVRTPADESEARYVDVEVVEDDIEDEVERAKREAYAAYGRRESEPVDVEAEVEAEPNPENEAQYVDVEVMDDSGPESEANYAQVDVVPEDSEKEGGMKNANAGRWKREAKEEWVAQGGFFGGPVWDWTKKIAGGVLTGLVTVATFVGGWLVDLFEGFTELFTKKSQKK